MFNVFRKDPKTLVDGRDERGYFSLQI
jgi:hypothetical protein